MKPPPIAGWRRGFQQGLFAFAAVFATDLAFVFAAGGAGALAALFTGLASGEGSAGESGDGGCGDEDEDGFHDVVCLFLGVPAWDDR